MTQPTPSADHPAVASFTNHVMTDWDEAMNGFFAAVEKKMEARGLTPADVTTALDRGYGDVVADAWEEWVEEGER